MNDWREPPADDDALSSISAVPAVMIDPVEAGVRTRRGRISTRVAAVAMALGLAGGGVVLAVNAGSSIGGAATPQAAVEQMLRSLSNEDILGAAEMIEPGERDTIVDTGVSIANELVRLEVLSTDLDLSSLTGVDLDLTNLQLRTVQIFPNVAQVFVDGGASTASIDVSELPLGRLILDRAPDDWLSFTHTVSSPIASTNPIAVVERGGRWYVSLWYSVAENARLAADRPLPLPADRPAPIGADSPEGAVERLLREAVMLDPRTVIGMLDPEEMAALYDYAALWLPDAESSAQQALRAAANAGVTWSIDSVGLSSEIDGSVAGVKLESLEVSLTGPELNGHLSLGAGTLSASWTAPDYRGDPNTTTYEMSDGCLRVEYDNPNMRPPSNSCDSDGGAGFFALGPFSALPILGYGGADQYSSLRIVTRKVGGKWYVSPIRTAAAAALTGLRGVEPQGIADTADSMMGMFTGTLGPDSGFDEAFAGPAIPVPGLAGTIPVEPTVPLGDLGLDNSELLPSDLPVYWAFDLSPEEASSILDFLAPVLSPVEVLGGVQAFVPGPDETNSLTIDAFDLNDESRDLVSDLLDQGGVGPLMESEFGLTSLVVLDGNRLLIVGGFDIPTDFLREFAAGLR